MYLEFYGLTDKPFQKTPDPRFFFRSRQHEEALNRLLYAVEEREMAVLTGEIGTGKTLLTRALIDNLNEAAYKIILLLYPCHSPARLIQEVGSGLGIKQLKRYKHDILKQINTRLFELYEQEIVPVLIIEEAQLIPKKGVFDELRLLTNFQLDDAGLLSLILVGQPELKEKLTKKPYRAFRQRIGIHFDLKPLSQEETTNYISNRLTVAGCENRLFTSEAMARIHHLSGGLPRSINNIAHMALMAGFTNAEATLGVDRIEEAAANVEGRWE